MSSQDHRPNGVRLPLHTPVSLLHDAGGGPVVFVSYAQESRAHSDSVAELCEFLAAKGVEPHYDQQMRSERISWEDWTNNEFQRVDYVLVIASPAYRDTGANRLPGHKHRGLRSEYLRLVDLQHEDRDKWTRKILPVVLPGRSPEEIPRSFRPFTTTYYQVTSFTDEGAADLLGVLFPAPGSGARTRVEQPEPDRRIGRVTKGGDRHSSRGKPGRTRRPWIFSILATAATAAVVLAVYPRLGALTLPPQAAPAAAAPPGPLGVSHSTIATALHSDGAYDVFGIDTRSGVIHSVMGSTTGDWGPWTAFGPYGTAVAITAAADSGQLVHVMVVMANGSIQQRSEETPGQWGNWQPFAPAGTAKVLALGLDHYGQLNAFAVSPGGQLISRKQLAAGSNGWSDWTPVALSGQAQSVAATRKADGYLDVLAVMKNGAVEWADENRTGFRPWVQLGPPGTAVEASISQNADGMDDIFAVTPSRTISNIYQDNLNVPLDSASQSWSAWTPNFEPCCTAASVNVGSQYGQRLAVLVLNTDGTIRFVFQNPADGPWTGGWRTFGPPGGFAMESPST